jgi:hypothetical protein
MFVDIVCDITSRVSRDLAHSTFVQTHYARELLNPLREAASAAVDSDGSNLSAVFALKLPAAQHFNRGIKF